MRLESFRGLAAIAGAAFLAACGTDTLTDPASTPAAAAPRAAVAGGAGAAAVTTVTPPELPRVTVNTDPVVPTGKTITVAPGASLQAAINAAVPGDVIVLTAGATYTGSHYLPNKVGTGWVTIRTSTPDNLLPPGVRVGPAQSALLAKVVAPTSNYGAFRTSTGAHHYRLIGLEVTAAPSLTYNIGLLTFGSGSVTTQNTLAKTPTQLIVDRSYVHGHPTLNLKNCITLYTAYSAVIDSYVSECHSNTQESHGINAFNGPGPFKIENNYIEAGDINLFIGGANPASPELMPADITVRRNHITRPLSYKGVWTVKALVEFKLGRRALFEGNVFENNWVAQQSGFAFNLKTDVGSSIQAWARTEDITLRYNIVRDVAGGVAISAAAQAGSLYARRFRFEHNLWENVGASNGTSRGRVFYVGPNVAGVQVERNTVIHATTGIDALLRFSNAGVDTNLVFRDNVATRGTGVQGDYVSQGKPALDRYAPGYLFAGNVLVGTTTAVYPAGTLFAASLADVGFVDLAGRDYRLAATSPYRGRASDGTDPGADIVRINTLTAGVVRP